MRKIAPPATVTLEYIGGPLDGKREQIPTVPAERLEVTEVDPVRREVRAYEYRRITTLRDGAWLYGWRP
jgi:hypothetical protein